MLDISPNGTNRTLMLGNKLSVLGGDFLLAKASIKLARIQNTHAVEMISKAIGHLSEGAAMEDSLTSLTSMEDVENLVFHTKGSLLAHSCYSAAKVVGHTDVVSVFSIHRSQTTLLNLLKVFVCSVLQVCQQAFNFGRNLSLVQQCAEDIEEYQNNKTILSKKNFVVVYSLSKSNELRKQFHNLFAQASAPSLETTKQVKDSIRHFNPDILAQVKRHCDQHYVTKCRENIQQFPVESSVEAINDILSTIRPV